jgi:dephospho-CoA kinase
MILIGLTGNIASGKSTVADLLAERGVTIVDADLLARRAVEPGTSSLDRIRARWGNEVLRPDGSLDRAALRHRVFSDPTQLEELNAILHPEIARLRDELVGRARDRGDRIVVCDIPLLFERHLTDDFDGIVLVDAPRPLRLERLMKERGIEETEAMAMIAAQMPSELKRARADHVIDNGGSLTSLDEQVEQIWQSWQSSDAAVRLDSPEGDF